MSENTKGISIPDISIDEFIKAGSDAFSNQLKKMTEEKIIAPYFLIEYHRDVIDIYKKCLAGNKPSEEILRSLQNKLNLAIDQAKINNQPTDELENLKNDINHLKYELL